MVTEARARETRAYRSPQREAQARRTRERAIDAASAAFLANGYAATTIRGIADAAGVAVPTIEHLFGTKARVLRAAIDVAIAGDHEPVPVLDRPWTRDAATASDAGELLAIVAGVLSRTQARSAGLVLAVFEAGPSDPDLEALAAQLIRQRTVTAAWMVDRLTAVASLRSGCSRDEAIDTVWLLMDPAVYDRLTRHRHWTADRYERWFIDALTRLLLDTVATAAFGHYRKGALDDNE